jgi:hypothetical protein
VLILLAAQVKLFTHTTAQVQLPLELLALVKYFLLLAVVQVELATLD